jgi:hypothetical protein
VADVRVFDLDDANPSIVSTHKILYSWLMVPVLVVCGDLRPPWPLVARVLSGAFSDSDLCLFDVFQLLGLWREPSKCSPAIGVVLAGGLHGSLCRLSCRGELLRFCKYGGLAVRFFGWAARAAELLSSAGALR